MTSRGAGQHEAVARQRQETLAELRVPVAQRHPEQQHGRQQETEQQRQQAGERRQQAAETGQAGAGLRAIAPGRVVVAGAAARDALDHQQEQHEGEQHGRQLRGGDAVAEREPGAVNAGGKGVDREIGDRAVVGQRFHQRQRDAGGDRRSGQRQRHREERPPRAHAQRPRRLEHAAGPFEEGGAGEQVDIGIEHADEHQHRPRQRADVGKPVVAVLPAEGFAQRRLQRPDELQEVGIRRRP